MMFKGIYMHTKPLKHAENIQILTNYINKNKCFSKFLTDANFWKHFSKTPEVIICMRDFLDVSDYLKNQKLFK